MVKSSAPCLDPRRSQVKYLGIPLESITYLNQSTLAPSCCWTLRRDQECGKIVVPRESFSESSEPMGIQQARWQG